MRRALLRLSILTTSLLLLVGSLPGYVHAGQATQATSLSDSQYWDLVESSLQAVLSLKGQSPNEIQQGLDDLKARWQGVKSVTFPDGQTIAVDESYLLTALTSSNVQLDQVQAIFESLEAAHKDYPSRVFTTADLTSLRQILAGPQFRNLNQSANPLNAWVQNLWDRFANWLTTLLQKLFGNRIASLRLGRGGGTVLEMAALAILILILYYAARMMFVDFTSEGEWSEHGSDSDAVLTAEGAFERAQRLSRGGDYRSAVRYLYLSCLLLLDERGLLRYDRTMTNREVLRSAADLPELAGSLREVIDVFDRVWYGFHSLDADSFTRYSQRVHELQERKK